MISYAERLKKIEKRCRKNNKGCLLWTGGTRGGTLKNPYPHIGMNRKSYGGHRLIWLLKTGQNPGKLMVLHKCDETLCLNFSHLYLGTAKDNARDRHERRRSHCFKITHCPKGHEYTKSNTMRVKGRPGKTRRICRECFNKANRDWYRRKNNLHPKFWKKD